MGKQGSRIDMSLANEMLGVSEDDICLTEGDHKSLSLPEVWSPARTNLRPFGNVQRGKEQMNIQLGIKESIV